MLDASRKADYDSAFTRFSKYINKGREVAISPGVVISTVFGFEGISAADLLYEESLATVGITYV